MKRFTLIELLVVIGIVSILATMIITSLRKARDKITMGVCINNLSQIGKANAIYLMDSNDIFPVPPIQSSQNCYGFFGKKGEHTNGGGGLEIEQKPLNAYLDVNESNKDDNVTICPNSNGVALNLIGSSYMVAARSDCHDDLDGASSKQTLGGIHHTTRQVLASSYLGYCFSQYGWSNDAYQPKDDLHSYGKGIFPYVFIDGHAVFMKIKQSEGVRNNGDLSRDSIWFERIDWTNIK
jgi:prepilin-type N-terminal cleavage/methylation domain-containing protein